MNNIAFDIMRQDMSRRINADPGSREALEDKYGRVWSTDELTQDFEVIAFAAPFVQVKNKSTGSSGSMAFQAQPRFYFDFHEV